VGFINVPGIYSEAPKGGSWLQTVHEKEGRYLHNCGIQVVCRILIYGELPHAPSALNLFKSVHKDGFVDTGCAKEMTIEDIKQTVLDFKTEQKMLLLI
jgi:N-ethylmaleimide reductase